MAFQLSACQVLSLAVDERVLFVMQNLSNILDGTLNIQNLTGWDDVSKEERDLLAQNLL